MEYTFVYRKGGVACSSKIKLDEGIDLAKAIQYGQEETLITLGADKNSPLLAIVK